MRYNRFTREVSAVLVFLILSLCIGQCMAEDMIIELDMDDIEIMEDMGEADLTIQMDPTVDPELEVGEANATNEGDLEQIMMEDEQNDGYYTSNAAQQSSIRIDSTTFPDRNFREYIKETCDTNGDGLLSQAEISATTDIYIGYEDISSVKGLEYFVGLKAFCCDVGDITELDISKNKALQYLSCTNNQLSKLDTSKNPNLLEIHCDKNKLTELDVSKNKKLQSLSCYGNKLTKLDLRQNTKLRELRCSDSLLTELDLSKNALIEFLSCEQNRITTLNLKNNKKLQRLYCNSNQISKLDIGPCSRIVAVVKGRNHQKNGKNVSWKSADGIVLSIDSNTVLKSGSTVLYRSGSANTIALKPNKATLYVGESAYIKVNYKPQGMTEKCKWTSSNSKIVRVSSEGKIIAVAKGTATITAQINNGKKATCKVTVKAARAKGKRIELTKYFGMLPSAIQKKLGKQPFESGEVYFGSGYVGLFPWSYELPAYYVSLDNDSKGKYMVYGIYLGMEWSKVQAMLEKNGWSYIERQKADDGGTTIVYVRYNEKSNYYIAVTYNGKEIITSVWFQKDC